MELESMEFDVLVVSGGAAGLAAAIRLRHLAVEKGHELSVCPIEVRSNNCLPRLSSCATPHFY